MENFEITEVEGAPDRIIGAFFGSNRNYFRLKTDSEESFAAKFALGAFDADIRAYHRLILTKQLRADDRRTTIELQLAKSVQLNSKKLMAVIMPEPYFLNAEVRQYFKSQRAKMFSYQLHPLNVNNYYAIIYEKLFDFFAKRRLM